MVEDGGESADAPKKKLANGLDPSIGKKTQFKPGNNANPDGRGKGNITLATLARNILEGEELDWSKVPVKNNKEMQAKYGKRGWNAIIHVATAKAVSGDIQAMKWLSEVLYGGKIDITTGGQPLMPIALDGAVLSRMQQDGSAPLGATADSEQ